MASVANPEQRPVLRGMRNRKRRLVCRLTENRAQMEDYAVTHGVGRKNVIYKAEVLQILYVTHINHFVLHCITFNTAIGLCRLWIFFSACVFF